MAFSPTARATPDGLDLVLFDVDDDNGGFDFSDHGETGTDDAPFDADAWDDVLNAFDAYREDASAFDVDAFGCAAWPDLDGEAKDDDDFDGYDASRRNAAKAVREHVASALRDALSACESELSWASDEGEWETKRREAEDAAKAIKYVRSRVYARLRALGASTDTATTNRLKMLRDMFVAELRTFAARADALERRAAETLVSKNLCLNLPDPKLMLKKKFNTTLTSVLDSFDAAFEHVVAKAKTPSTKARAAASRQSEQNSGNSNAVEQQTAQGRHEKHAKKILSAWLWDHFYPTDERLKPIPTRAEKEDLARQTGLTTTQVGDWFVNARARLWKPYIEGLIRGVYNDATVKKALDLQAEAAA